MFVACAVIATAKLTVAADAAKPVSFKNQVAPILAKHCVACHGAADPKGDYQLQTFAAMMKAGESHEPSITPGNPAASRLYALVSSSDESVRMPSDADPLDRREIETLRRWIQEGATFDGPDQQAELTSYLPRRVHPAAPESYRAPLPVTALAFNADGTELAVSGYHEITLWNAADGTLVRRIGKVDQHVYGLDYQPGGMLIAAATGTPGETGEAVLYDTASGKLVRVLVTSGDCMLGIAFSPDGKQLACCGADRAIRVFDVASGKRRKLIEEHADWVLGIAWNHAGTQIASASRDKVAKVFDVKSGDAVANFAAHAEPVYTVAFSQNDETVFSGGGDRKVRAWKIKDAKENAAAKFPGEVLKIIVRDKHLFATGAFPKVHEFNYDDLKSQIRGYVGHSDYIMALAVSGKTKRLASGSYDGEVRVWNTEDGKLVTTFRASPGFTPTASASRP
jgi:WD40 repeat protein